LSHRSQFIVIWGAGGVTLLLMQAIVRLSGPALALFTDPAISLSLFQIVVCIGWTAFNLYAEGYRAFQLKWAPRVAARAYHLGQNPTLLRVIFAPLFCMSFFHASRKGLIVSWVLTGMIVCIVIVVRQIPPDWRGIIDVGVVLALIWGVIALWTNVIRWWRGGAPIPNDLPDDLPNTDGPAPDAV
jgi:hypothetical protein